MDYTKKKNNKETEDMKTERKKVILELEELINKNSMNIRKTKVNILKEQKDVERFYTFFSVEIFFDTNVIFKDDIDILVFFDTNVIFKDDIDILVETFKKRYKIFRIRIYFESKKLEFCLRKRDLEVVKRYLL